MVHGSLSVYRLSRLIKYSFYKNVTLAFLLFFLQPFDGWSGACRRAPSPLAYRCCAFLTKGACLLRAARPVMKHRHMSRH